MAPDSLVVALANNRGGSGDNYGSGPNGCLGMDTIFGDRVAAFCQYSSGVAPFAGRLPA